MSPELAERIDVHRPRLTTRRPRATTPPPTCSSSRRTSRRCRCRRSRRWRPGFPWSAAPVGGAVESVRDGETGVFVERGDAARARAARSSSWSRTRRAAPRWARPGGARAEQYFSWDGRHRRVRARAGTLGGSARSRGGRCGCRRTRLERAADDPGKHTTNAGIPDAYDDWHRNFETSEDPIDTPWHQLAIPHLPPLDGMRVLEIGCGRGGFSRFLASHDADLVAADFSPAAVDVAQHLLPMSGSLKRWSPTSRRSRSTAIPSTS